MRPVQPVEKIYVVTSGRRCLMKLAAPGETLTEAVFPLNGDEGYVRVDCRTARAATPTPTPTGWTSKRRWPRHIRLPA